jgi:hypothetical protein
MITIPQNPSQTKTSQDELVGECIRILSTPLGDGFYPVRNSKKTPIHSLTQESLSRIAKPFREKGWHVYALRRNTDKFIISLYIRDHAFDAKVGEYTHSIQLH